MPSAGLSLVGFMDQAQALAHLKGACVPAAATPDAVLLAEWAAAQARLGPAAANVGQPQIDPIPPAHGAYLTTLVHLPWVAAALPGITETDIKMVEIDPLLALQFTVDVARSNHHCAPLGTPPSIDEILACCLPHAPPTESFNFQVIGHSALIKSRSLNLRLTGQGIFNNQAAGILFGPALPLVQVVRLNGRYYLHKGFHRAVGIRRGGGTHLAAVVRDVPDAAAAGIAADGTTFSETLLASPNPPTLGHFTQGRAHDVQLRLTSRILHVSWSNYIFPEE